MTVHQRMILKCLFMDWRCLSDWTAQINGIKAYRSDANVNLIDIHCNRPFDIKLLYRRGFVTERNRSTASNHRQETLFKI